MKLCIQQKLDDNEAKPTKKKSTTLAKYHSSNPPHRDSLYHNAYETIGSAIVYVNLNVAQTN